MKEAAGEANLTVVAIILIAVIVAIATPLVNSLMRSSMYRSCCTDAGGVWESGRCMPSSCDDMDGIFRNYDQCVADANHGRTDANEHWFARENC